MRDTRAMHSMQRANDALVTAASAGDLTSMCLKVTILSWGAKFGIEKGVRRMLGGHLKMGDRSVATYSRDEMAEPLRRLQAMLPQRLAPIVFGACAFSARR